MPRPTPRRVVAPRVVAPRRVPAVLVALAVAAPALVACSSDEPSVGRAAAERGTVTEVVDAPATVVARASATVAAPADAVVEVVQVEDGQRVEAGQPLVLLRSDEAQRRLDEARAADAQAGAAAVDLPGADLSALSDQLDVVARASFASAREALQAIPDPAVRDAALARLDAAEDTYEAAAATARESVRRLNAGVGELSAALSSLASASRVQTRAAVDAAERAVAALQVTAPVSGVVQLGGDGGGGDAAAGSPFGDLASELPPGLAGQAESLLGGGGASGSTSAAVLAPGVPVDAGSTVASVVDTSSVALQAEVDETDVLLVTEGVDADVELDAVPDAVYSADVAAVDVAPGAGGGGGGVTYRVRLDLGPGELAGGRPAPAPRPGMSAVARLEVRTDRDAVTVPASALVRDGRSDAVWVSDDGRASRRPVVLGAQGEDRVAVVEGLEVGDVVVVSGADTVTEGQELAG